MTNNRATLLLIILFSHNGILGDHIMYVHMRVLLGGEVMFGGMLTRIFFKWCVLVYTRIRFCFNVFLNYYFLYQKINILATCLL